MQAVAGAPARPGNTFAVVALTLSTLCVQGSQYIAQLATAALLGPEQYGTVRTVESVISIALLIGACGMPSVAVLMASALRDAEERSTVLRRLMIIAAGASVAVAAALWTFAGDRWLAAASWTICLAACTRTCIGYMQGRKEFGRIAAVNGAASAVALVTMLIAVHLWGLGGWLGGRYASEVIFAAGALVCIAPELTRKGRAVAASCRGMWTSGLVIANSLLLRTGIEHAGVLTLTWLSFPPAVLGNYGLSSLICAGLLILPGSIGNVALPEMADGVADPVSVLLRNGALATGFGVVLAAVTATCAPLLPFVFGEVYRPAIPVLAALAVTVPLRAATSMCGSFLLARNHAWLTLLLNLAAFGIAVAAFPAAAAASGCIGVAWCAVGVELFAASSYAFATYQLVRRS